MRCAAASGVCVCVPSVTTPSSRVSPRTRLARRAGRIKDSWQLPSITRGRIFRFEVVVLQNSFNCGSLASSFCWHLATTYDKHCVWIIFSRIYFKIPRNIQCGLASSLKGLCCVVLCTRMKLVVRSPLPPPVVNVPSKYMTLCCCFSSYLQPVRNSWCDNIANFTPHDSLPHKTVLGMS